MQDGIQALVCCSIQIDTKNENGAMSQFLRDEQIENVTIDRQAIGELVAAFVARGQLLPEFNPPEGQAADVFLYFTIRFDQKGYRVHNSDDLLKHFDEASEVERIIFELRTGESIKTNDVAGSMLKLHLDTHKDVACFLTANADDENWMNGSFSAVKDVLARYKNHYGLVRNAWVNTLIQLFGLLVGFFVSLWAASRIAPSLTIQNAFLISFLLVLLIFSSLWTPINQKLIATVQGFFPDIKFYRPRKDTINVILQGVVIAIVAAFSLWLLNEAFKYVGRLLGAFVGK